MAKGKLYLIIKSTIDIILAFCFSVIFIIPFIIIIVLIKLTSRGPVIHWSKRVGINNKIFLMAKFRTMKVETPVIELNSLITPDKYYICFGKLMRKSGIDELPQIYNIFRGEMSFVGPRPLLYNHHDYIFLRNKEGIDSLKPGLTGLAVIKGRNNLTTEEKVCYDKQYFFNRSILLDFKIIFLTSLFMIKEILNGVNINKE